MEPQETNGAPLLQHASKAKTNTKRKQWAQESVSATVDLL